jgi:hypothetical protein
MPAAALGLDFRVLNAINLWLAAPRPAKEGRADLASIVLHEERPDLGELKKVSDEPFASIAGELHAVLMPQANYDRMESLWLWIGWIQGQQLLAKCSSVSPVAAIQVDSRPALIRPPMTVSSGELDILFLAAEGRELQLARFTPGKDAAAPAGSVLWRFPLPARPVVARAALGPPRAKSPRRLLLGFQEKDGAALHLYDLADGKAPAQPVIAKLPGQTLLPDQQPGLMVDDDNNTLAAVLLAKNPEATDLAVADFLFAPNNPSPQVKTADAKKLPVKPAAAALTYSSPPDHPLRRDWAVLMANGKIVNSVANGDPMTPFGIPALPLELAAMSRATYFLTQLPTQVTLEPLR